jgi:misacylated tRNA(Ala) deacylase
MSLHTSQHLLSALLETRGLPTLSWSLTTRPQPCYIEIPRAMTAAEITSLQDETNRLVFEGRKVHVEVQELDDNKQEPLVPKAETGRLLDKGLPSDYTGGVKRIVVIDGIDRTP